MDYIELTGMVFYGYHGCLDFEKTDGQKFIVDARLYLDLAPAGKSDDLSLTVNYASVYEDIKAIVTGEPLNLIEAVAERIAADILKKYPLEKITVILHKPQAPIDGEFSDVSLSITRTAERRQ